MRGVEILRWWNNKVEYRQHLEGVILTGHPSWVISDKFGDLDVPFSRIIALLNSCGKLLLARLVIKGKFLNEVVVFARLKVLLKVNESDQYS